MKKFAGALAVLLSFLMLSTAGAVTFNSANTVIVLPTTKVVSNVPLHINEDAIAGSRLGAFLVLKGIVTNPHYQTVEVPVEYHSILIKDENQSYVLTSRDMPDLGLPLGSRPIGKTIVLRVNFDRVRYNSTKHMAEFMDRSVEIVFNENTTPLNIGGNYRVVYNTVNGTDYMYFYSYQSGDGNMSSIGDTITFGSWSIHFIDININQSSALVEVSYPSGVLKLKPMLKGKYYLMYLDAKGNEDYEEYDTYPSVRINELLKNGVVQMVVFTPTSFFIGVNEIKSVIYSYWFYEKEREYHDGEVYSGQWVWDIDPQDNLYVLYLHVKANTTFEPVFIGSGARLEIPIQSWGLSIVPVFNRTKNGGVIVGVLGYRFVRTVMLKKRVKVDVPTVVATNDVNSFIINDTALQKLPSDKNVIIIGGWVSNKAWKLLEGVYGSAKINELKNELESKGYIVAELPNPYNASYKVVILAGKTYRETAKAVEEFMEGI
ncbi:S-layer protein [Thermococcus sp.]|uniref:S-layer protein n=1 Tax=Thermococcus sp. TaxID=35749 RepID=UPI00260E79CE|nr:S-layer protein [Thermococcus sp.]